MTRLQLGQRVVIVVALGLVLAVVGGYVTRLGGTTGFTGWVG